MTRDEEIPDPPRHPKRAPSGAKSKDEIPREGANTYRPNPKKAGKGSVSRSLPRDIPAPQPIGRGPSWWERILFGRVGSGQLAVFCRQFAAYLDAGVDMLKTLTSLQKQYAYTALGPVIERTTLAVRQGDALAETLAREPQVFDKLFISMITVAEARGGVPETLSRLAHHYEARQNLIRQARSAAIYPIAVLLVASGVVTLITVFLLPKFIAMLKDIAGPAGASLPWASRALMAFSDFVGAMGWWLIPLAAIGTPFLLAAWYRTKNGKRLMDEVALYVPVLGKFLRKIDTTRFARTLGALLGAGVDIGSSLALTADVMQLDPFQRAIRKVRQRVLDGSELSEALDETHHFAADVIAITGSGEETGKLPEALERLADDYEEQVAYMVKNLGQLVQPLIMILLGGIVLFIILAVLLPYISMLTTLAGGGGR